MTERKPKVKKKAQDKKSAKTRPPVQESVLGTEAPKAEWKPEDGPLDPGKHKVEPVPGDGIPVGPGEVDAAGQYYMEELDFLRLQARRERSKSCSAQAAALRSKAEILQLKTQIEHSRFLRQAAGFDSASRTHDQSIQEMLTELSKKYDIDFKNPGVHIDEDVGKIVAIDPEKGLPRLSSEE